MDQKLLFGHRQKHPPHPPAMNTGLSPDEQFELVRQHVTRLLEFFDTVQILVSNSTEVGTRSRPD
jgi:hypothetical protein